MKQIVNNEGWTLDIRDRNSDLFSIPIETVTKQNDVWIYLCHIASSPGLTRRVYFVDKLDKNAWVTVGQFKTKAEALTFKAGL